MTWSTVPQNYRYPPGNTVVRSGPLSPVKTTPGGSDTLDLSGNTHKHGHRQHPKQFHLEQEHRDTQTREGREGQLQINQGDKGIHNKNTQQEHRRKEARG